MDISRVSIKKKYINNYFIISFINKDDIEMYQIYYTMDKDLTFNRWNTINVPRDNENIKIDGLRENTVYYVRIRIYTKDRKILDSPTIYRFTTSGM